MPMLKKENIGAINWGLVAGKTNTIVSLNNVTSDAVPTDAIVSADGKEYIFVVTNKKAEEEPQEEENKSEEPKSKEPTTNATFIAVKNVS
jgi:hypothetical protein